MCAWNKLYPLSTTSGSGSPDQIRENFEILGDWWDVEHSTFTSAGSGAHEAGKFGIILTAPLATISALTSPGTGAVGYATDYGMLYRYSGTEWAHLTADYYSRLRQGFGTQTISAETWTSLSTSAVTFSGSYDTLDEFDTTTYRFVPKVTGIYLIKAAIEFPITTDDYLKGVGISKNGTIITMSLLTGISVVVLDVSDIILLSSTDYIELAGYHNHTDSVDIIGGSLHIMRLN